MTASSTLAHTDILFLNWRDPAHPQAGGAETYCFEIARRLARTGARVTLFASRSPGAAAVEYTDGVRILRQGGTFGVYAAAVRHLLRNRHAYDAVVDFQNGIPFFSAAFVPRWTADVCVIHHVHQDQFDLFFRWPANAVGRLLEKQVSRIVYRNRPIVVVSPSTREGVRRELGFHNPVFLVPNGSPHSEPARVARSESPRIAVVSRLVPQKRLDLLVRALPALLGRHPDLRVDIAGQGGELGRLRALAEGLGVGGAVTFHGWVGEERKRELLARAWLTVVPSVAEGWGLAVIEANSLGTPAVAFDVPGLRDAVRPGRTGWLLPAGADLADLTAAALDSLADPAARERMAGRCRGWADGFGWGDSADRLARVVQEEIRRVRRHRRSRRQAHDLAVVTHFETADGDALEATLDGALRGTDGWSRRGDAFRLVLHGCDEVLAHGVLARLGVGQQAAVALASRSDLLVRPESSAT
ncbi:glycosyltransferase family 4 protein [Kitasatospora sp. NBC_00315]|uniref:glycosyltransferase family 4 protein n=1 Tax=Kitasatospora sp. NBC_00315 TaxID=2975963 RepID=UPI00324EA842